jgi:GH24 family phage-related lysozyme (muramidase)
MELHHIESAVPRLIKAPLTQNQFDALASFTFNLGSGRLQSSTLRAKTNRLDYEGAADEFPKWRKAGGRVLAGLVRRRAEERRLWMTM